MVGKPVITGTRIPVELLLKMLAQGMSEDEILKGYPRLRKADLRAAVWGMPDHLLKASGASRALHHK